MEDTNSSTAPQAVITILRHLLVRAEKLAKTRNLKQGSVAMWTAGIR